MKVDPKFWNILVYWEEILITAFIQSRYIDKNGKQRGKLPSLIFKN